MVFCSHFVWHHGLHSRAGLSRVEVLVFLGILALLATVGWLPLSAYLERGRVTHAVECARTINTLLAQYALDNNGVYPAGQGTPAAGRSEGIARNLLENNYTPDASVFAIGSTTRYGGTAADFSDLAAANLSWDFTAGATNTTGLTSEAPDLLPTVYTTGETVSYPTRPGAGLDLPFSGQGPFGKKGVVVAYKGNNAVFIPAQTTASGLVCPGFISPELKETAPYSQIRP